MISVCMAMYNGAPYLKDQISSILSQIEENDELIIVDDASTDNSCQVVDTFGDPRIRLIKNSKNLGVRGSFKRAISESKGSIIFLSDQDDIWLEGKVKESLKALTDKETLLVAHPVNFVDKDLNPLATPNLRLKAYTRFHKLLIRNRFVGATMAFKKELKGLAIAKIDQAPMHDWWLALLATKHGKIEVLDRPLINYRRHDQNVTELTQGFNFSLRALADRLRILKLLLFP